MRRDEHPKMSALCRDCAEILTEPPPERCPACRGRRIVSHPELDTLTIAHIDCDAFYASVEKRDDPSLAEKPVIVGGAKRGVVSAACYVARTYGVRSAMPMFKALKLCPDAVVLRPRMEVYAQASKQIRAMMEELTPYQLKVMNAVAVQGAPLGVVAERLGSNRNALNKLIHDARLRLKSRLEREGFSAADLLAVFSE